MSEIQPLVLDTGVISRYSFSGRFDILKELYGGNLIVPNDVLTESWRVSELQKDLQSGLEDGWIEQFAIDFVDDIEIATLFGRLTRRFGPGESAVLSIAKVKDYSVGSDDMRAAAKYCNQHRIPLIGSLGVLHEAYEKEFITAGEAESIHTDMINKSKYRSPVKSFQEVIDWFQHGEGKKLY